MCKKIGLLENFFMKKRIIIDTNIWISYFLNQQFEDIAELILENDLIVFSSIDLIEELRNVLGRSKFKKQITLPIERYINFHKELVNIVNVKKIFLESPDPKDNFLFDLAIQTKSQILITGDKKLLAFKTKNIDIISLTDFRKQWD